MLNRLVVKKINLLFLVSLLPLTSWSAIVIKGDSDTASGQTFTFPISAHVSSPEGNLFYVGANSGSPKEFALARTSINSTNAVPLAQEKVTLNNVADQTNPLYNQTVRYLGLLSGIGGQFNPTRQENPIVVLDSDPRSIYVRDTFFPTQILVESVSSINDANGIAITSGVGIVGVGNMADKIAVAVVAHNGAGNFGAIGSGLALLALGTVPVKEGDTEKKFRILRQIDALTGSPTGIIRSLPLNITSPELMINTPLASISDNVNMYWDEKIVSGQFFDPGLDLLFVGLQVMGAAGVNDGARAVTVVAPKTNGEFALRAIAPNSVFTPGAQNEIIGALGSNAQVSINILKTMKTSTNLNYLIVQGGNGSPLATQQTVFALPLVNSLTNPSLNGTIADKTQIPNAIIGTFSQPATTPAQMTIATDDAAIVGGSPLAVGPISDMFVRGDSVFVTVANPNVGQLPGIFFSQAIFDEVGKIAIWSNWQRAGGSTDQIFGGTLDILGNFTSMVGNDSSSIQTIKRTTWGTNDGDGLLGGLSNTDGLISIIGAQLPQTQAGVQGLFDFPASTPGLTNSSWLISTGLNTIVIAETGQTNAGIVIPNTGDFLTDYLTFNEGIITQNLPGLGLPKVITISGGVLNNIGPIVSAEIAVGNANGYLFVGGIGGLAVFAHDNGSGWNAAAGLGPNFLGLTEGMKFQTIDSYSFVRKLVVDGNLLYVLTDTKLDVINLSSTNILTPTIKTLATINSSLGLETQDTFIDFIVSGKFALLGTSKGLLRVGNGKNISTASNQSQVGWTQVPLPESVGPVTQLLPITKSGRAQQFAKFDISNINVLNAYVGTNVGQVARFVCKDLCNKAIDDTTLQLIPNYFVVGIPAPIINYNGFRDMIATDGASFLTGLSRKLQQNPFVQILFGLRKGMRNITNNNTNVPLNLNSASHITRILRNSASGSWLVGGDFGLQVNE